MAFFLPDFAFGDRDGLNDWLLQHDLIHARYTASIIQSLNIVPTVYPIATMQSLRGWLEDHSAMHRSIGAILGMNEPPDLAAVDWNRPDQFENWKDLHESLHELIDSTLSL